MSVVNTNSRANRACATAPRHSHKCYSYAAAGEEPSLLLTSAFPSPHQVPTCCPQPNRTTFRPATFSCTARTTAASLLRTLPPPARHLCCRTSRSRTVRHTLTPRARPTGRAGAIQRYLSYNKNSKTQARRSTFAGSLRLCGVAAQTARRLETATRTLIPSLGFTACRWGT